MDDIGPAPQERNEEILKTPIVLARAAAALATSVWESMSAIPLDLPRLERNRIVSLNHSDPAALAYDMLRTKLMRSRQEEKWRNIGITSPTTGCGKTTMALNLALSLARQRELRVALVDMDLRRPRVAAVLGHRHEIGTEDFLMGRCPVEKFMVRLTDNLAVGASPRSTPNSAELLQHTKTRETLARLVSVLRADIVIYDLPPMLVSDDCLAFLPAVDRMMLVVGAEQSTVAEIDVCERELSEQEKLLGVVLNKCRHKTAQYDNYQS
jgi:capsular exopolysaccharide synthesis family protein